MDWTIVIAVSAIVGVLGTVAAVLWWRLVRSTAPYGDEGRPGAGRAGDEHVVVIREDRDRP